MGKIIITLLMLWSISTIADPIDQSEQQDGEWVQRWWDNVYEAEIKQEQKRQVTQSSTCERKVEHYHKKLTAEPASDYYQWMYKSWKKQCDEELSEKE